MATPTERAVNKALRDSKENLALTIHALEQFSRYAKKDNYKAAVKLIKAWEKKGLTLERFTNYHKAVLLSELSAFEYIVRTSIERSNNK